MISQDKIKKAWFFAANAHKHKRYPKDNLPYLVHLGDVAFEIFAVKESLKDFELALTCAILHDVIEDTSVSYKDIVEEFSKSVADGVLALTKDKSLPKSQQMVDSLQRISQQPPEIGAVKMADRICNLLAPPKHWNSEKVKEYAKEAELICDYLCHTNSSLSKRLKRKIQNYYKNYVKD